MVDEDGLAAFESADSGRAVHQCVDVKDLFHRVGILCSLRFGFIKYR